jgi:photosystem II stability/assembly factor-like uncharacterized protein
MSHLYVATNGLSVWSCDRLGDGISRMPSGTGLYSGSQVWALASHRDLPGKLFAGTDSGLYRLDQATNFWTHIPSPMDEMLVTAIAIAPDDPRVIIAGTQPSALFRSDDAGASWRKLEAPLKPYTTSGFYAGEKSGKTVEATPASNVKPSSVKHWTRVTQILFDPQDSRLIWAGVEIDGAWRSRDGGDSWERISDGLETQDVHGFAYVAKGPGRLFMTSPAGIYVSENKGSSWRLDRLPSPWQYTRSIVARPDRSRVMFVTNGNGPPGSGGKLFRSREDGLDWEEVSLPGEVESSAYFLAVHPSDPMLIYLAATLGQIYRSTDGGESWTALKRRLGEIRAIAWLP